MSSIFPSASKSSPLKSRVVYYEDLTTMPLVLGLETSAKSGTVRRLSLEEVRQTVAADEAELALLPMVDALRLPNHCVVPSAASSTIGPSRLFMIYSKKLPTEIRRVLVDKEDFGTNLLAKLLFAKKLMIRPEFVQSATALDPSNYNLLGDDGFDAYLIAGKANFSIKREAFAYNMDLTGAWYEYSKLPYVIHCWVAKKGIRLTGSLEKELSDVVKKNEASSDLATRSAERSAISATGVKMIYEKAMITAFDPAVIQSLRKFGQEVLQARLLNANPVALYAQPSTTARRV